ncbi:hypothetical protein CSH63_17720 [Micromonospora tulbaghiae]|uniref:Uncharacterized protein n=1 Tax=Micromonospora tulbaghiae TaxID=479978 RepID=A0A386WPE9_9ACTN|nr:hypothetical protein [Micromonospora tulbaghiae]AYF29270.1 hypothetical protein CSH63_17720 [Micromonospora tulbaghiae]
MIAVAVVLVVVGLAALAWLVYEFVTAPYLPDPGAHATAAAALTPDAPLFTDAEQAAIDAVAGPPPGVSDADVTAAVDQLLTDLFPPVPTKES